MSHKRPLRPPIADLQCSVVLVSVIWIIVLSRLEQEDVTCNHTYSPFHFFQFWHPRQGISSTEASGPPSNPTWPSSAPASPPFAPSSASPANASPTPLSSHTNSILQPETPPHLRVTASGKVPRRAVAGPAAPLARSTNMTIWSRSVMMFLFRPGGSARVYLAEKKAWRCRRRVSMWGRRSFWVRVIGCIITIDFSRDVWGWRMRHEDKSQCYGYDGDERYTSHWLGTGWASEGNEVWYTPDVTQTNDTRSALFQHQIRASMIMTSGTLIVASSHFPDSI